MKLSGVIEALIAAGGTTEQIAAVVRAAEAEADARDAEREARDAERRAKQAQRKLDYRLDKLIEGSNVHQCPKDTMGHNGTDGDTGATPAQETARNNKPTKTLDIIPPSPPTGALPPGDRRPGRGMRLPADWLPKDKHFAKAAEHGKPGSFVADEAEGMRIWAGSNGTRKVDWDLTFDGWLRRELRGQKRHGPDPPDRPNLRNPYLASAARDVERNGQPPRDNIVQHPNAASAGRGQAGPILDLCAENSLFGGAIPVSRRYAD